MSSDPTPAPRAFCLFGLPIHRPIRTGQPQTAWSSMLLLCMVWFTFGFHIFAGGVALAYTVKRYNNDPRVISIMATIPVLVMLGPFISYASDNLWTRIGRRRPFLMIAWAAGAFGMASLAFLPEITSAINSALGTFAIPGITEFLLLAIVVVSYTTLMDFQAPLEPLFLEVVPPQQRGRFFAMRSMFFTASSLTFYQIFWPVYDDPLDMFAWLGAPGGIILRGEQIIYIVSAALFLITGAFLLLCVDETKVASAPNKRPSELGVGKFMVSFFKNVFLAKDCYMFYFVLVIPQIAAVGSGNFDALMKTDQWGWSKGEMALLGLPTTLIQICLLSPFAGWYSDKKPAVRNSILISVAVGAVICFGATVALYQGWRPLDTKILPPLWQCLTLTGLMSAGSLCLFVIIVELVLRRVGREHIRIWVTVIAMIKDFSLGILTYTLVQLSPSKTPEMTFWMVYTQFGAAISALIGATIAPMMYEYIPRNKMGTINAGTGVYGSIVKFSMANVGAWWIVFFSSKFLGLPKGTYDYTCLMLLGIVLAIPGLIAKGIFLRQVLTGRIKPLGLLTEDEASAKAAAEKPAAKEPAVASIS